MTSVETIPAADARYAATFAKGASPFPAKQRCAALSCMDAQAEILGLEDGDARIVRTPGGRAGGDTLRSLVVAQQLHGTEEILVIRHTDGAMRTITDAQLRQRWRETFGLAASGWACMPFSDRERSVRDDVVPIRACPFLPADLPVHRFSDHVRGGRPHLVV